MGVSLVDRLFRRNRAADPAGPVRALPRPAQSADPAGPVIARSIWTPQRLAQAEALWGDGYIWPGGAEEIKRLTAPFGLSAAHTLLLVGAGAGGPARTIASDLGVWVSGFEADAALVAVGAKRLQRAGKALAKRATVKPWNPDAPDFGVGGCHFALALDVLGGMRWDAVLSAIVRTVKQGGQVMVVQSIDPTSGDAATIASMLELLGCDVRVVEDESARHGRLALHGWKVLVRQLRGSRPSPAEAAALVAEAEHWLTRIRQLRAGRLALMRWCAIVR